MNVNKENPNKEKQVQNIDDKILDDCAFSFSSNCEIIAELDSKQNLVDHLVSENKRREVSGNAYAEKNKAFSSGEGAITPMFGSIGSLLFEPVAGSMSSTGDVRPGKKRFVSNTLVQPFLPTLVQPQLFVQLLWHQAPFQAMGSGPVSFGGHRIVLVLSMGSTQMFQIN
ncbi:7045_t:CDS:2, partial [Cetraspora pellucida]